jgi:hypothetical protein
MRSPLNIKTIKTIIKKNRKLITRNRSFFCYSGTPWLAIPNPNPPLPSLLDTSLDRPTVPPSPAHVDAGIVEKSAANNKPPSPLGPGNTHPTTRSEYVSQWEQRFKHAEPLPCSADELAGTWNYKYSMGDGWWRKKSHGVVVWNRWFEDWEWGIKEWYGEERGVDGMGWDRMGYENVENWGKEWSRGIDLFLIHFDSISEYGCSFMFMFMFNAWEIARDETNQRY